MPFVLGAGTALLVAGLAVGGVVLWQARTAATAPSAPPSASTAASVVPTTTAPSAGAPVIASSVPVAVATAGTAPPKRAGTASTGAPVSPSTSASTTAAPPVSAKAPASSPVAAQPPPPKNVVTGMRLNPTMQYDRVAIERMVLPMRPLVELCFQKHPLAGKLPTVVGVGLELWNVGNDMGKVRDVRVHEAPALAQCIHDVFITLSFGPPKDPKMPPGAVFVSVEVSAP